ncbi:MAG: lytic transglycosylase domain-containing protein [Clostridiales bacterium]|jgi:soluble lytic murein transglycosylase|nr:lytic transglycosylase domain-containing protein [Clostridiales bacterium]
MPPKIRKIVKITAPLLVCALASLAALLAARRMYPLRHEAVIAEMAGKYGLEEAFVCAVINTESRFRERAVSSKGASGLMQLRQPTADWGASEAGLPDYSYERIFEPRFNIEIGCWYISRLLKQYEGDVDLALAAYNGGSGNVAKWLADKKYSADGRRLDAIPFKETENYVKKVKKAAKAYRLMFKYVYNYSRST